MGGSKRRLSDMEDAASSVAVLLVAEGALIECEIHSDVYYDAEDQDAVERVKARRPDLAALVDEAMTTCNLWGCPYCEKNAASD